MDERTLFDLVGVVEHEALDFKRGVPSSDIRDIPAMAMTDGGLIVLGVDDDRRVVGCELTQETLDRIKRYANECNVEVQVAEVRVDGVPLTVVEVPEVRDRIVTTPDGRLLRRVGGDCQPLVGDALARFVRARAETSAEEEPVPDLGPDDIDLEAVNAALRGDGRLPVERAEVMRALVDLDVAEPSPSGAPTALRAAAVLFARRPDRFVPGATVQLVRRSGVGPGPGPTEDRVELTGPMAEVVDGCLDFIARHTRRYEVVLASRREQLPEYPASVLREAIVNALAHRDYGLRGATVDVTVWDDRVEIQSPGSLPGHITLENMRYEHFSRNRRIMRVLKRLGLVEEYGDGVDRMIREMEARLMEPPVFSATAASVTVTLRNRFLVDIDDQAWLMLLGDLDLSPHERRALVLANREGDVTPRRLRQVLPDVDVGQLLDTAVAKGLLVRVGRRGGSRYVLSEEVVLRAGATGVAARMRNRQRLLEEIRRVGSISTAEGAALLGEDPATVRHLLNDLVRAGLARAEGRTRARRYHEAGS